jgi:CubicO group peptidase (beta-lactamase class C family)
MAALGQLFLQGGRWKGRQVVPADWVRQATRAQAGQAFPKPKNAGAFDPENYGFFWWLETADRMTGFYALGFGGQLIEVVPQRHLVIVVSSEVDLTKPAPTVGPDDLQELVDAIVPLIRR